MKVQVSLDQIKDLCCFMVNLNPSTSASTSSFTQLGTLASAFSASVTTPSHSWIIDLGASDHMMGMSSFFSSYSICFGKDMVKVSDRPYSSNAGRVFYFCNPNLTTLYPPCAQFHT